MSPHRARRVAVLGSLLVYLIPLIGPHALFVLGALLVSDLTGIGGDKAIAWAAADIVFALALQVFAFLLLS
jgi:hypothetical protein